MRPLKLAIEGLRSFRTPVTIDFRGRDQLAIVGDTGAGKSSILDAITYALYRQTTFSKQPNQELVNASAGQMRVALTFGVSGQTWVVTRALKRMKDGVVSEPPELSRLGDDGEKLETFAGMAGVNERVQYLVGLDGDAFLRTVVMPQGNFARLLIADTPAERATVLRQVWRTDELEKVGEVAGERADEAKALRMELDAEASLHPEDPDAHLKALQKERTDARKEAKRAKSRLDAASAAVAALDDAAKESELCQGVLQDLDGADFSELAALLDRIRKTADEITRQDEALAEETKEIEAKISEILQDGDGPSLDSVTATVVQLNQVDSVTRELAELADDWRGLRERKADADRAAVQAKQFESNAKQELEKHSDKRKVLDDALANAQGRLSDVEARYAACRQRHSNLEDARNALLTLQEKVERQKTRKAQLDDEVKAKQADKDQLDAALLDARRADSAASAASGLHTGDPCPVCDRELQADWQAPTSVPLSDAEQRAGEAAATLGEVQQGAADATATLAGASAAYDAANEQREGANAELQEALHSLRKVVPEVGPELPVKAALLGPLHDNQAEARSAVVRHEQKQARLDDALRGASQSAGAAKDIADDLALEAAKTHGSLSAKVDALRSTLQSLPQRFRPSITLPADVSSDFDAIDTANLDEVRSAATDLQAELEEAESDLQALESRKRKLLEQQDALNRRRRGEVEVPLADGLARATKLLAAVTLAIGKLGTSQKLPAPPASAELAAVRGGLVEIREALEGTRQAARKRLEAAEEKRQGAGAALAKFARHFDVSADDRDAIAQAASQANIEAQTTNLLAEQAFDDFSAVAVAVQQLHAVRAKTEAKERALSALAAALKPGGLLKWLTLRRSRSLLSHASVMLKQISGGRYAFSDPEGADAQWHVLDNDTGQARSPASLSGGEQFIASLALALGMVEMMARSGGRLESLFLDEGFGSLDRNNLDAAVEALAMVATRGRMVGVISHVRAVAEQFDNVLAVTREETGSRAVWLSNQQRQDVAADALSGLLD